MAKNSYLFATILSSGFRLNPLLRNLIIGCRGEIKINPRLLMTSESSIIGCQLFQSTEDEWKEISEAIVKGIEDGWVKPTINKSYPLKEVGAAHNDIINTGSKGASGKLVVKIED